MSVFNIPFDHQLPTAALMKFSGAQGDPYTNWVATVMLEDFKLSVRGARNINTALTNLPVHDTQDERLSFGWSPYNFIRSPNVHMKGYEHLGLAIALIGTFHQSYAAEVMHEMASQTAGEDDMLPHLNCWRRHLRLCAGLFAPYGFDILVEDYIRLDPYSVGPGSDLIATRCRVPPKSMATAMLTLRDITCGKRKKLTLVGGAVIGWYIAVCEWFFDLRVAVFSEAGAHLHGLADATDAQVVLIYHQAPDLEVRSNDWTAKTTGPEQEDRGYRKEIHILPFGGRVVWNSLLPRVFGQAFHHLDHEHASTLATAIGAAARSLEGGVKSALDGVSITSQNKVNSAAYGEGLIKNLTAWLPELRKSQGRMERQLKKSYDDAGKQYHEAVDVLRKACNCRVCADTEIDIEPREGYCLTVIMETIVALGLSISRMVVSAGIYPTREGIQGLYYSQAEKRASARDMEVRSLEYFMTIYGNEWNAPDSRRLQNAVGLFSGRRPEKDIPPSMVAIAHEGMCAYMLQLEKSDTSPPRRGDEGVIRIVSGAINIKDKIFTRMCTEPVVSDDPEGDWTWEAVKFDHISKPCYMQ